MAAYTIRLAHDADLDALPQIEARADQIFSSIDGFEPLVAYENLSADGYRALPKSAKIWIAEDRQPIGFIYGFNVDDCVYIAQISVVQEAQGHGIGRALIHRISDDARQAGKRGLVLCTFLDIAWNAPLYKRLGFSMLSAPLIGPELRKIADNDDALWSKFGTRVTMGLSF